MDCAQQRMPQGIGAKGVITGKATANARPQRSNLPAQLKSLIPVHTQ